MLRYTIRRILWLIPITLGVSLLVFSMVNLVPGDPGTTILGASGRPEDIEALNEELGYNLPFWTKYSNYIKGLVKLDFGRSYITRELVATELKARTKISVTLAVYGILSSLMVGIPLGILSAVKQYSLLDTIPTSMAMMLSATPSFWVGLMLMYQFALKLGWFPSFGLRQWNWFFLPVMALTTVHGANMLRFTRSSMLETIRQDYIRTVRSKGATERVVIWKHALKNALIPVVTIAGTTFGGLIGGSIVVETLFSLPGLGTLVVTGIKQKDVPVVMGGVIIMGFLFSIVIILVDLIYALIDPNIKAKYSRKRA